MITLDGVGKAYGRSRALHPLDLDLGAGITGLLGPNGAGKTTLLRILATVLPPTEGSLQIFGLDPREVEQRTEVRRRLGYLPQELGFPSGFTVFAFVDYLAVLKEHADPVARREEVRRVLDLVDLTSVSTKKIRALSGGQRRRLALAQALVGSPSLLVLDEPTTGLDPEQRVALRAVLAEVARTATVLLSTHQTEDVAALCDQVVVLDAGRIVFRGAVRDLVARADGCVWLDNTPDSTALASWRLATGQYRNVGRLAPPGCALTEPTLEDAYLLLRGSTPDRAPV